ncbi:MAG: ATP-binding cassette domain-containing protein [Erysipelotrichaceae bacterium]
MLQLKNISKKYKESIIENANFDFSKEGHIYGIGGESGTGKTTLLHILFGLDNNFDGEYIIDGISSKKVDWSKLRSDTIQLVFQDYNLIEELSVKENINLSINKEVKNEYYAQIIEAMNLEFILTKRVRSISGGEKQRVAIARALMHQPKYLLLDEPTANLDESLIIELVKQLEVIKNQGVTIILVSHNMDLLNKCDTLINIENKKLVSKFTNEEETKYEANINKKKYNFLKYILVNFKRNYVKNIIPNILKIAIIILLILFFVIQNDELMDNNTVDSKFDENVIEIGLYSGISIFNEGKDETKIDIEQHMLGFSKKNIEEIEKLEHVSNVELFSRGADVTGFTSTDINNKACNEYIKKNDLPMKVKKYATYAGLPNSIPIKFRGISVSNELRKNYYNFLEGELDLSIGKLPKDNSNEVVISDTYAYYLAEKLSTTEEKLLNTKIKINTCEFTNDSNCANKGINEYTISGIHTSDYENKLLEEYTIYTAYVPTLMKNTQQIKEMYPEKTYTELLNAEYAGKKLVVKEGIYKNYESYIKALGTGVKTLVIIVDDKENVPLIEEKLNSMFPSLKENTMKIYTKNTKPGFRQSDKKNYYTKLILYGLVGFIVFIFIRYDEIRKIKRNIAILFSQGYSKDNMLIVNVCNELIQAIHTTLIAYASLFMCWRIALLAMPELIQYFDIIHTIFSIKVFSFVAFMIIIIYVSFIIFVGATTTSKQLSKYLKKH